MPYIFRQPTIRVWLGGSFDPIHCGHMAMLAHIYEVLSPLCNHPIHLYLLPTSGSPLKTRPTPSSKRLAMLELACQDYPVLAPFVSIDTTEIYQPAPVFTFNTLQYLQQCYPNDCRIFVMGQDSILNLDKWYRGVDLIQFAHLWIIPRPEAKTTLAQDSLSSLTSQLPRQLQKYVTFSPKQLVNHLINPSKHLIYIDDFVPPSISSSEIRSAIAKGQRVEQLSPSVQAYILQQALYLS